MSFVTPSWERFIIPIYNEVNMGRQMIDQGQLFYILPGQACVTAATNLIATNLNDNRSYKQKQKDTKVLDKGYLA